MYKPLSIFVILFLFIFLFSCAPVNYSSEKNSVDENIFEKPLINNKITEKKESNKPKQTKTTESKKFKNFNNILSDNITVLISKEDDPKIINQFLNIIELAVYKKKNKKHLF